MIDKKVVRTLWTLANRLQHAAEIARNANLPHELNRSKRLLLRNVARLNKIRDAWADRHVRTRRPKVVPIPLSTGYWQIQARFHGFRRGD